MAFTENAPTTITVGLSPRAKDERDDADALKQNFLAQHEIGHRFQISPDELPPPKSGSIVTNRPLTLPYAGQVPQVPPGFKATPFATGLVNPRAGF